MQTVSNGVKQHDTSKLSKDVTYDNQKTSYIYYWFTLTCAQFRHTDNRMLHGHK